MNSPLVSIIITTKNEESNISRLLKSVKGQSYKNIETIVVDNNSTDKTKKLAKKYTHNVYNMGPERSVQRNYGVSKAKGKFVVILDADMELGSKVIADCVQVAQSEKLKILVIPETTAGESFLARVRSFEREMYAGDSTIEVARFFDKKVFKEFDGYDENLTGAEDYDLPARISKKYKIGRSNKHLTHHEKELTLLELLKKKYYYASKSVAYADKHPELVAKQGTILFRASYLRSWRKFLLRPVFGVSFIFVRMLVMIAAISGYVSKAGIVKFSKTFAKMIKLIK